MDRRTKFLNEFLGALGAQEIRNLRAEPACVSGTVVYDPSDPEEQQEFRWSISSTAAPSVDVIRLAALIRKNGMLRGDKLIASRDELLAKFNAGEEPACSREQFEAILDELLGVEVPMLDDGVESDCYFMHE